MIGEILAISALFFMKTRQNTPPGRAGLYCADHDPDQERHRENKSEDSEENGINHDFAEHITLQARSAHS
ncbi:MAG: hypothetical protein GTN74_03690 [Proteobacteria bacterium]|nr:hypothetical protein [Pseudomonadota bacterium]